MDARTQTESDARWTDPAVDPVAALQEARRAFYRRTWGVTPTGWLYREWTTGEWRVL